MGGNKSVKNILIGGAIVLVAVLAVAGFRHAKQEQKMEGQAQTSSGIKSKGPDSAAVRIVGFSDFQCPACSQAGPVIDGLIKKYPGKIQYVFKHFPLRMHVWAPVAHQSAECVAMQGNFWEYYNKIYADQAKWGALPDPMVTFAGYAKELGVDMQAFASCMADAEVAERIMAEKKEGEALAVRSTPTFFINGKMFAGIMELQNAGEAWIRTLLGLPGEQPENAA